MSRDDEGHCQEYELYAEDKKMKKAFAVSSDDGEWGRVCFADSEEVVWQEAYMQNDCEPCDPPSASDRAEDYGVVVERRPELDRFSERGRVPPVFLVEYLDYRFGCYECHEPLHPAIEGCDMDQVCYQADKVFCNAKCLLQNQEVIEDE